MDIGYFARIVRALFIDQLLYLGKTIEPQLAFDPNSYSYFCSNDSRLGAIANIFASPLSC
jgi:hypothetical protein